MRCQGLKSGSQFIARRGCRSQVYVLSRANSADFSTNPLGLVKTAINSRNTFQFGQLRIELISNTRETLILKSTCSIQRRTKILSRKCKDSKQNRRIVSKSEISHRCLESLSNLSEILLNDRNFEISLDIASEFSIFRSSRSIDRKFVKNLSTLLFWNYTSRGDYQSSFALRTFLPCFQPQHTPVIKRHTCTGSQLVARL